MKRSLVLPVIFLAAMAAAVLAQRDFSQVEIKTTHVAGNVHMLEGAGGNIGVSAGPDGVLIVDDQFAPLAGKIRAALKPLGSDKPRFVLNTHWHGDHTGGNAEFAADGTIIAHTQVRQRLSSEQRIFGEVRPPSPPAAWPVITFDHSLSIHFNGEEIEVLHFPTGHTDGDSVIFFKGSNVVHMGDDFFAHMFPFVDLDSGGDVEGLARNIAAVLDRLPAGTKVIPGHGPLSTPDDLRAYHRMLTETTELVRRQVAAGKSLEEIQAAGVPEEWQGWGSGFINTERWLAIVHRSLTRG